MVYRTLATAGITYDEGPDKDGGYGPYVQTERMGIYKEYAENSSNSAVRTIASATKKDLKV